MHLATVCIATPLCTTALCAVYYSTSFLYSLSVLLPLCVRRIPNRNPHDKRSSATAAKRGWSRGKDRPRARGAETAPATGTRERNAPRALAGHYRTGLCPLTSRAVTNGQEDIGQRSASDICCTAYALSNRYANEALMAAYF